MPDDHYDIAEPVLIRMASAPRTRYDTLGTAGSMPDPRELAADPLLREAIQVASADFADRLDQLDGRDGPGSGTGLSARHRTRTALSVTRYALRISGRPTPFGLFAGVSAASIGDTARAEVRGPGRKLARLDAHWLDERVRHWLQMPEVRQRTTVVINDLCRTRGERLVLPTARQEISLRHNPLVSWIRETAARPVRYDHLLAQASRAFPQAPPERIDTTLAQLLSHGFLLTSITPLRLDGPTLDRIETAVDAIPGAAETLREIRKALRAYQDTKPGEGGAAWHQMLKTIETVEPSAGPGRPPVQVDLRMDTDIQLPRAVAEEARHYASAMWAISGDWVTHAHLRDYRDRFIEKYGIGTLVPLGELVDPHRGLGFPDGYRGRPEDDDSSGQDAGDPPTHARRLLTAELVQQALLRDDRELRLTPELIDRLAATTPGESAAEPPRSLELCFQLLADSVQALGEGNFRLICSPYPGSWTAGATSGRFAELTGMTEDLASLMGQLADQETLPAQVVYRPHTVRALNMAQTPRLLTHQIPVGVYADRTDPGHLDWRELLVGIAESGMRLVDERTGRRVLPVIPHRVDVERQAPEVVRLLADIAFGQDRTWTGWEWCGLETLPALPRVTFGKVTLTPARWLPDHRLRDAATDPEQWDRAVREWQRRHRVPDRVQVSRGDRVFGIDLTAPWHRTLLRHEVRTGRRMMLAEDLTAAGRGLGWARGHSTEVVIPLTRSATPTRPEPAGATLPTAVKKRPGPSHLPGEDWLFAKVYATADSQDELLLTMLPPLLRDIADHIDRWFFIRYRDPGAHLRLRLHGEPEALRSRVLPALARHARAMREAGAIHHLVLDAYEPETDRYGGPEALPLAERLFCLDSQSAVHQLGLRTRGGLDLPAEVLSAVNHALLLESLGDWDWCSWVDRVYLKGPRHTSFQRHRALARELIRPGQTAQTIGERHSAPALAQLWTAAPEARAYGDLALTTDDRGARTPIRDRALTALLHMQHNRLLGIDPDRETKGYAILRGIAREHLGHRTKGRPA